MGQQQCQFVSHHRRLLLQRVLGLTGRPTALQVRVLRRVRLPEGPDAVDPAGTTSHGSGSWWAGGWTTGEWTSHAGEWRASGPRTPWGNGRVELAHQETPVEHRKRRVEVTLAPVPPVEECPLVHDSPQCRHSPTITTGTPRGTVGVGVGVGGREWSGT